MVDDAVEVRVTAAGGAWRVDVRRGGARAVGAALPADALGALHGVAQPVLEAPLGPLVRGRDAGRRDLEERLGVALGRTLFADPEVRARALAAALDPSTAAVLIDAPDGLPWELLALGDASIEPLGGVVARWMDGPPLSPEVGSAAVSLVAVDPSDPATRRAASAARRAVEAAGGVVRALTDEGPSGVVLLIAHGEVLEDRPAQGQRERTAPRRRRARGLGHGGRPRRRPSRRLPRRLSQSAGLRHVRRRPRRGPPRGPHGAQRRRRVVRAARVRS